MNRQVFSLLVLLQYAFSYPILSQQLSGIVYDVWGCANSTLSGSTNPQKTWDCGTQLNSGVELPICVTNPSIWKCATDFERYVGSDLSIVSYNLYNRVPAINKGYSHPSVIDSDQFSTWFLSEPSFNIAIPSTITLTNNGTGNPLAYTFSSTSFFPIDGLGFGNQYNNNGVGRNYGFTFVYHGRFTYQGSEFLQISGNDDLFIFINDRLAINAGGVYQSSSAIDLTWPASGCNAGPYSQVACSTGGVNSSTPCACLLGLEKGKSYSIDLFYAQRHTVASTLSLTTTIGIQCPYYDFCGVCQGDGQSCCNYCDDKNACTVDTCDFKTGACIHTPVQPPTVDLCTTYTCNNSTGAFTAHSVTCVPNNSDPCVDYGCSVEIGCYATKKICDDNDPCTVDTCDQSSECVFSPISCNDNNICTTDTCSNGQCVYSPVTCNQGNACTNNTCDPRTGCTYVDITSSCVTGNKCTVTSCNTTTGCYSKDIICSDGNACTIDSCNVATGCIYSPINCDDNNKCTTDSCDSTLGCQYKYIPCIPQDSAHTASCIADSGCIQTLINCDDNNKCTTDYADPATGCSHTAINCDDNNVCTADSCDPAIGCVNTLINFDDGNACTTESCTAGGGLYRVNVDCDDGDYCTVDSCNTVVGCIHTPITCTSCISVVCTTVDACFPTYCNASFGHCQNSTYNCDDGDACTIDTCDSSAGYAVCKHTPMDCSAGSDYCHPRYCDPLYGKCVFRNITCDDNNDCTTDSCTGGSCVFTPITCPYSDNCAPQYCSNGVCVTRNVVCDDNNKCTNDTCLAGNCIYTPITCSNSDPCNPYICNTGSGCVASPVNCDDANPCTYDHCTVIGNIAVCRNELMCNTTDPCNSYTCDMTSGCVKKSVCETGNPCVTGKCSAFNNLPVCEYSVMECGDMCHISTCNPSNGQCELQELVTCNDNNNCTVDTCDSIIGCKYTPITCNDNDLCTQDYCDSSRGCMYVAIDCDDGNACTKDTCNATNGCVYTAVDVPSGNQCLGVYCDSIIGIIEINTVCPYSCNPSIGCNLTVNATTGLTNGGITNGATSGSTNSGATNGGATNGELTNGVTSGSTNGGTTGSTSDTVTSTVTFTFTSPSRMDESEFVTKMAALLGVSTENITIISYSVSLNSKRADAYSVNAVFEILGAQGSQKAAELQVKVNYNDPSLGDAGFNNPTITVTKSSSTTMSDTTGSGDGDTLSNTSTLYYSTYLLVALLALFIQ